MIKPKLWKYKSGEKKGKLRTASKKYLSFKLKDYHKRKRILKEQFKEEILIEKVKKFKPKRIRKQICYNCHYSISLRAIQINGNANLQELEKSLEIFLNNNPALYNIDWEITGLEEEEIDDSEDKNLKNGLIYVEFNNKGEQNLIIM